ncbi:hypothetical protein QBC33DRAFT_566069 [Phialemonium atrogriseum]|uniref:Clr5 domain-containing protein n=1 Tax=Phialemonium atrogriseum TaxID=1093897 RepID=A0AAJ0CCS1_9PEZI|nr:uncharacterized protein QBC33DRAFT_566069 [Phialemonium atrogriseum]KAK1771936.1 hypothetical protein QBC33DRAFT_566069 [Phialemonium atrogriseum]
MQIMKEQHSFNASQKLYKDKFKEWNWQKNLPARHAHFMTAKATKRKREEKKDTIFFYGGQTWTSERAERTLLRTKKTRLDDEVMDMNTPEGVRYKTPDASVASPKTALVTSPAEAPPQSPSQAPSPSPSHISIVSSSSKASDECVSGSSEASLTDGKLWEGHTRSDLLAMSDSARVHIEHHNPEAAGKLLLKVLAGYRHILGPAHEDATEVAYAVAKLFAETGRIAGAVEIIEDMAREHVERLDSEHKRTQQHVLRTFELLRSWDRQVDALGLLARSKELLQTIPSQTCCRHLRSHAREPNSKDRAPGSSGNAAQMTIDNLLDLVKENSSPANLDFALLAARPHVAAGNEAVEKLLRAVILQCSPRGAVLDIKRLKARAEFINLYMNFGTTDHNNRDYVGLLMRFEVDFEVDFEVTCAMHNESGWDSSQTLEVIEIGMQLAVNMLKGGHGFKASKMFRIVEEKSATLFGASVGRTIWILISIGLAYQEHTAWEKARPWFQRALGRVIALWGPTDGLAMALQRALGKQHFSGLSGESRALPFSSILGIPLSITGGRLHLA